MFRRIINLIKSTKNKEEEDDDIQEDTGIIGRVVRPLTKKDRTNISSQKQYEKIRKNL
jgi:hypothetical protein